MRTAEELYQYCVDNGFGEGMSKKWGKKHFSLISNELQADEDVLMAFIGLHNYVGMTKHDDHYAYAVTNRRILMAQQKLIGHELQSVMLDQVNDVTSKTGLVMGVMTINTIGNAFNVAIDKKSVKNVADRMHTLLTDLKTSSSAPVQNSGSADELIKFKQLLDMGVITQDEFDAKKKQILGL